MKKQYIIFVAGMALLLSSCHIYTPYKRPEVDTKGLYRDPTSLTDTLVTDTTNLGDLPWDAVFTDPQLQALIRLGLEQNPDLQTAMLRVKEAEAGLRSAKLAYTPSLALAPQGGWASTEVPNTLGEKWASQWTWTAPVSASWEIDIFGKLLNAKRGAQAALMQTEAYRQAVQTQVIATIANTYYSLLMLDKQLEITEETSRLWKESVETMRAMKEAGMVNEAAVVQSEANSYMIDASIPDLKQAIRETENALSVILYQAPHQIERGKLDQQRLPDMLDAGVPVQLLANRPDVLSAEMALASAYYTTNQARSAFYPSLSITGNFGWTNDFGSVVLNPGKMIANAVGSLVAPIFSRGANSARLRVAKAQQEEALIAFQTALLNAGSEVSNALYLYKAAEEKRIQRELQIDALEKSVEYTRQLLSLGTSTYLEVLTAQQSLLSARLTEVSDEFQRMQAVVNLYHALGGGRTE